MKGIEVVKPGSTLGDIGHAIQEYVKKKSQSYETFRTRLACVFHSAPYFALWNCWHGSSSTKRNVLHNRMMINAARCCQTLPDGYSYSIDLYRHN